MTYEEKRDMVKVLSDENDDSVIFAYLSLAGNKICRLAYPYDKTVTEVPERYAWLHVEAAVYMLNKRGAEGETAHNENGINRTYENADLPDSLLKAITPVCGVTS